MYCLLLNFKFQNLKNFTLLFSIETLSGGRKLTSIKERAKSKADNVKNSDNGSDKKVESDKGPYIKYIGGGPEGSCGGHEMF